jgi:deoxyuridine 5'-triphosphate nucleotidohydrolase
MIKIQYVKVSDVKDFEYSIGNAGIDFFVPAYLKEITLKPNEDVNIESGYKMSIEEGYALLFVNKSGQATKKSLQVGATLVDSSYTGEIHLHVRNIGTKDVTIYANEKLVQAIIIPDLIYQTNFERVDKLTKTTNRGENGFGSTGI